MRFFATLADRKTFYMQSNLLKPAIYLGLLLGMIMILEFFVFKNLDVDGIKNPALVTVSNLFNYVIFPSVFIILSVLRFKNKYNQGYVSFSQVLRIGVATTVISALVLGLFSYIYYNYISPEFIEQTIEKMRKAILLQREELLRQGAVETDIRSMEEIGKELEGARISMQSFFSVAVTVVLYSVIGIVISITIGAFVKRDKPQTA